MTSRRRGTAYGFIAALAFGCSAPLAKSVVGEMPRLTLLLLWYVGAAVGLVAVSAVRPRGTEPPLDRGDIGLLLVVSVTGGLAPFLQVVGLEQISGITGALLLGLELPFTALLAVFVFRDRLEPRELAGLVAIFAGGALLGVGEPGGAQNAAVGVLATVGACAVWALDNNLTQRLSARDPLAVARVKTFGAAILVSLIHLRVGGSLPDDGGLIAKGLVVGFLSYGASEVFFVASMRHLGATRTSSVYASAPFLGALVAIPLLGVFPSPAAWVAATLIAIGLSVMLTGASPQRASSV